MDENKTVFFRSEVTYTQEALEEYQRESVFLDRLEIILHTAFFVLMLLVAHPFISPDFRFYYALFLIVFVVLRRVRIQSATVYNRITSQNEGVPLHQTYEFNDSHIFVVHPRTGNQYKFHYSQVVSIAQTKHLFIIYLEHRQYVLVEKDKLTGGSEDDFIRFLYTACPKIKQKKLRSKTFGIIIYYALIVLLCLVLLSSALGFLF